MDKTPKIFLLHISDAIHQIEKYVDDLSYEQFTTERKTQDAVIRQLEIIGEASKNLEKTFKESSPDIPWREITDFRNVLAHEYWDIDLDIIWKAIKEDVPDLKKIISPLTMEIKQNEV